MYIEKPSWIRHEGLQIFSLDIQPTGHRVATAGGDHKIRIWNMKKLTSVNPELDNQPKLLATLHDHFGSVNCVRWSKSGRFVASGSDDKNLIIHEKRAGTVIAEFGSGEPPDVENWKVSMTFRGHDADVVDLHWSPDDSMLASCSLDNTVRIWDTSKGLAVAVLSDHQSLVKGVTWDPIGSFVASQSDDRAVIIWRTSNWSLAHRVEGCWEKAVGSTFFMRLDWSPCGHHLTTTNGYQKPSHTAPVLKRGDWTAAFQFVGHHAPIIAVRFNHVMFKTLPLANGKDRPEAAAAAPNRDAAKDRSPYNVIAMGSQDCSVSVWTTVYPRPVCVAKHFFTQSVVDLSWSSDGYTLICCSLDGTVSVFVFSVQELGHRLGNEEMDEIKRKLYGNVRVNQLAVAESPAQLMLEAKNVASLKPTPQILVETAVEAVNGHVEEEEEEEEATDRVVKDPGVVTARVAVEHVVSKAVQPPSGVIKQTVYRRPDGRKRIIPESLGMPAGIEAGETIAAAEAQNKMCRFGGGDVSDARKFFPDAAVAGTGPMCGGLPEGLISVPKDQNPLGVLSIIGQAGPGERLCLEAKPVRVARFGGADGLGFDSFETDITCSQEGEVRWQDRLMGRPTALAGNSVFWAVALEGGVLQIYTQAGRRALPSMVVGSAAAFMDCGEGWKLLLLTCQGSVYLWDVHDGTCILHESLAPLYTSYFGTSQNKEVESLRVVSARLSQAGVPLVVLANGHIFIYNVGMKCWWRIADDTFPASDYISRGASKDGELAAIHVQEEKVLWRKFATRNVSGGNEQTVTRANLEVQLSAALALKSPEDYRNCLLPYVRCLTRDSDEGRLRELCEEFLGPATPAETSQASAPSLQRWEPQILGFSKRELLESLILPAMAANRSIQRLTQEMGDLLSEVKARQPIQKERSFVNSPGL